MKFYKTAAAALAVFACVTLSGCKELPMDYEAVTAAPQTVIVGEPLTLDVPLPIEKAEGLAVAVTMAGAAPRISVDYAAPALKITGMAEGAAEVQIEFSAGWLYKKSSITIPVMVELPQIEATATFAIGEKTYQREQPKLPFSLDVGSSVVMTVASPEEGFAIRLGGNTEPSLKAVQDGNEITFTAQQPGEALFNVIVSKKGFLDLPMFCEFEVVAIPVPLALPEGTAAEIKLEKGKTAAIALETDGELSVAADNANVSASVVDGKLALTGVTEGVTTVTILASKENYLDNTLVLTCTVTAAAPPAAPAHAYAYPDIVNDIVKYTNIERANEGLPPLKLSGSLSSAADIRAREVAAPGYGEHTRPDGRRGLTVIMDQGLGEYNAIGENVAGSGETETGSQVVQRWMDSPPHRMAILMPEFKTIGVGVYIEGDVYRYIQLFTGTKL